jgi:RHS repeat-associated protein
LITDTNQLNKTRTRSYDNVGNLTQTTDRNGRKVAYNYDTLNRQTAEKWLDSSNATIKTFSSGYDAVGHLLSSTNSDSTYSYGYDAVARISSIDNTGTVGVPAVKFNYAYDAVGNLLSVNDSINGTSAGITGYTYDLLNRVTKLTQGGTGVQTKRVDMAYNAVNQLTGLSRFSGVNPVVDTSYVYDNNQRLIQLSHHQGASTIASFDYSYDNADKLATTVSSVDGTSDYSYDSTNQLTGASHSSQTNEAYAYDANGNRTNAGYGTGTNNQLLTDGVHNYIYDDEGNRTRRVEIATGKVTEYVWDYRNRLAGVLFKDAGGSVTKTIDYIYDGNNQRIGKRIDGAVVERYVIDRNQIALVFDGAGNQTHRYLYGIAVDQVLADETPTGMVWALADNQGTVKDLVDNAGNAISHLNYDSFGRVVSQTGSVDFRYGYTGREQDAETGLDYYRARYYDASNGRFISEDPLGFGAGDTNIYRYVGNSPTNYNDPSGNVGNSVNSLPGIDPNCLANKPPLEENLDCKPGQESVPLSKARLEKIGRYAGVSQKAKPKSGLTPEQERDRDEAAFRSNIGNAFENNILRSIQSASGNQYSKYRGGDFRSPSRIYETNGKKQFVNPDLTGELRVREVEVDRQTGAIVKNSVRDFKDSSIVEIKSARADITYKYDKYQTAGFLDFAENTKAYKAGYTPRLQYITVAGSRIDKDLIAKATKRGVALYQGVAIEKCSSPGSIAVSKVILRNPSVYGNKNGRVIIPDGIAPSTIRSNFVEFRP